MANACGEFEATGRVCAQTPEVNIAMEYRGTIRRKDRLPRSLATCLVCRLAWSGKRPSYAVKVLCNLVDSLAFSLILRVQSFRVRGRFTMALSDFNFDYLRTCAMMRGCRVRRSLLR